MRLMVRHIYLIYCLLHISAHSSLVSDAIKRSARRQKRKKRRRADTSLYLYTLHGGLKDQAAAFFYVRRLGEAAAVIPIPYWPGRFEGLPSKKPSYPPGLLQLSIRSISVLRSISVYNCILNFLYLYSCPLYRYFFALLQKSPRKTGQIGKVWC